MYDWMAINNSDCSLMRNKQFFRYIMVRTSYILTRWCLLSWIFIVLALGRHVTLLGHVILISRRPVFALYSLMLRASWRISKYQFYNLWFDLTETRTHDLPHLRREHVNITPQMWSFLIRRYTGVSVYMSIDFVSVSTIFYWILGLLLCSFFFVF